MFKFQAGVIVITVAGLGMMLSAQGPPPTDCPDKSLCRKVNGGSSSIFVKCENSTKNVKTSRKICAVVYLMAPEFGAMSMAGNPGKGCEERDSDKAMAACDSYKNTYSPYEGEYKGKKYMNCYTTSMPYFCDVDGKKYLFCSVQAVPCT